MVVHEIQLRVALTPRGVYWSLLALLCVALPKLAGTADTSSLISYFPSPTGTFQTVTASSGTSLAENLGDVVFGARTSANWVWVGDAPAVEPPTRRMKVKGFLKVDGCIWLKNRDAQRDIMYRCKWE